MKRILRLCLFAMLCVQLLGFAPLPLEAQPSDVQIPASQPSDVQPYEAPIRVMRFVPITDDNPLAALWRSTPETALSHDLLITLRARAVALPNIDIQLHTTDQSVYAAGTMVELDQLYTALNGYPLLER